MSETTKVAKRGELVADDEYEIEVEEVDEATFGIRLKNDAARRALGVGQREAHDDSATTLANALDGTLSAISDEFTGVDMLLLDMLLGAPIGVNGESDGTPYQVTIHIKNKAKRQLVERCATASGIDRLETMRRLTTLALRLILFESRPPEDPRVHPMLSESTPKTVH